MVTDEIGEHETYLNDVKLNKNEANYLNHGDTLTVSNTKILLHIHNGNVTCIKCEPGEVMSKLSKINEPVQVLTSVEKEKIRRNMNLEIKKKFVFV